MFFIPLFYCNFDDQLSLKFHRFVTHYFMHYVVIHQLRILVFDNYQRCPSVPLSFSCCYIKESHFIDLRGIQIGVRRVQPIVTAETTNSRHLRSSNATMTNEYIAAELRKNSLPETFTVGDGKCYGGYHNTALKSNTTYAIYLGSVSRTSDKVSQSKGKLHSSLFLSIITAVLNIYLLSLDELVLCAY